MAVDGVNNTQATGAVGTGNVNSAQYLQNDVDPASELETLLRGTFDFCDSPEAVDGLVRQIVTALAAAGLETTGPLMSFVLQLAQGAKARLGAGAAPAANAGDAAAAAAAGDAANAGGAAATTTAATQAAAPTGALASDHAAARELEVLLYGAYASCSSPDQVANLSQQIRGSLERAGLATTGALPDFIDQLGTLATQTIITRLIENNRLQAEIDQGGAGSW